VEFLILGLAFLLLLALNAAFVLAEFSMVKVRSTRVAELAAAGEPRAQRLSVLIDRMDETLNVCQVGITLASVALGMVGKEIVDRILHGGDHSRLLGALVVAASYVVVSGSHILLGEQIPKLAALRLVERAALPLARPLWLVRTLVYPVLWLLDRMAGSLLRLLGLGRPADDVQFSDNELRLVLERSQERGMMSFRRLLFIENVFDLGELRTRDAMRPRSVVKCLDARRPWTENLEVIRASRFTRYPLLSGDPDRPAGFVHLKDVLIRSDNVGPDLAAIMRPVVWVKETHPLESLLSEMQRRRVHVALVENDAGAWSGFITLEDVIEELVGTIRDEFEDEELVRLADLLQEDHIHLDIQADSPIAAVAEALSRMHPDRLPRPPSEIIAAADARERMVSTYLGHGIAMPHARLAGLARPFVMILRSRRGLKCTGTDERAHIAFVLLTPQGQPRIHQRLQATIATLMSESEYVRDRLLSAESAAEVLEAIRAGEQATLD